MPLRGEAKREYDRLWRQRKRSHGERGDKRGSGGEKGVVPVVPDVVPHKKGRVVPSWVSDFPNPFASKSARRALEYMAYINARGYTVDVETGEQVDMLAEYKERYLQVQQRLTLVEAELALLKASLPYQRAEAILDDHLREVEEHGETGGPLT